MNYLELFTNEEEKTGKPGAVDIGSNKKGRASSKYPNTKLWRNMFEKKMLVA